MQNCCCQLRKYWSIPVMLLITPLMLWAAIVILPTFDDWNSLTSPSFEPLFSKERWLFYGYHWRPFDSVFGYILGLNPHLLFPTLNHCCVVIGHLLCSVLLIQILKTLGFSCKSINFSALFFFITPATMATVLAVDSMNQIYALFWGMMSFIAYVRVKKWKYPAWMALVIVATLCKENGLMWALITPLLAFAHDLTDFKALKKGLLAGLSVIIIYFLGIITLPNDITIHPEYEPGIIKTLGNGVKFLFTSFIHIDYIYLLHEPHRNYILAALSFLLAAPFLYIAFVRSFKTYVNKKMFLTGLCLLIAVGPHLITCFSMMHTYAGLPLIAVFVANGINTYYKNCKLLLAAFVLFIISALAINFHLWNESYRSGVIGKKMAVEAVSKTGRPVDNVFLVIIDENQTKLSSFCVTPYEAFGWGISAKYETNYAWPAVIRDTIIINSVDAMEKAHQLAVQTINNENYDCAWIVNHEEIEVVNK